MDKNDRLLKLPKYLNIDYLAPKKFLELLKLFLQKSESPKTIFLFLPEYTDNNKQSIVNLKITYLCLQIVLSLVIKQEIEFYCCYPNSLITESNNYSIYHDSLVVALPRSAMLESLEHRYQGIAYDRMYSGDRLALTLLQEWLSVDLSKLSPKKIPLIRYENNERYILKISEDTHYHKSLYPLNFKQGGTFLLVGALGAACCRSINLSRIR